MSGATLYGAAVRCYLGIFDALIDVAAAVDGLKTHNWKDVAAEDNGGGWRKEY